MTWGAAVGFVAMVVVLPLVVNEAGELAPWLAGHLLRWGAKLLGTRESTERYSEEWLANLEHVPGKVTKLAWVCGLLLLTIPRLRWQIRARARRVEKGSAPGGTGIAAAIAVPELTPEPARFDWTSLSDAQLVKYALEAQSPGERKSAFTAIADRYHSTVVRWCNSRLPDNEVALDAAQAVFADAFASLAGQRGPADPDKLAGWLAGITRNSVRTYLRQGHSDRLITQPADQPLDDLDDEYEARSGAAVRLAHVHRLVEIVVATLSERDRHVYYLYFDHGRTGRQIGENLGIPENSATKLVLRAQHSVAEGFRALILMQEGRPYCAQLARILDEDQLAAPSRTSFTPETRMRITRHLSSCTTGDNCRICNETSRALLSAYVP